MSGDGDRPRLLVADLNGLVHRAFHGTPYNAGALVFRWVLRALRTVRPTYAALAVDLPFPTFRHDLAPGVYKAKGRTEGEERARIERELRICGELCEDLLGVRTVHARGFEADDVIATLCAWAVEPLVRDHEEDYLLGPLDVVVLGRDKDLCQLVTKDGSVRLIDMQDGVAWGWEQVKARLGVYPNQVVDFLALVGDSTDGYAGCPGIGPVQAKALLDRFGRLDEFFAVRDGDVYVAAGDGVPEKTRKLLREGASSVVLSRMLAELRSTAPLALDDRYEAAPRLLDLLVQAPPESLE